MDSLMAWALSARAIPSFWLGCILSLFASAALAQAPQGGARVDFPTIDAAGATEGIFGYLYVPRNASPGARLPAMVVVHGSGGARDYISGRYGRELSAFGVVTLAIDSFTPRGVTSTVEDQTRVTSGQMARDAFAAKAFLEKNPVVDPARIGVMGQSKGGAVALLAADSWYEANARKQLGVLPFAAHIPMYPGCTLQYRHPHVTAPILVLAGGDDDYVGVKTCAEYVGRMRAAGADVTLIIYPGAEHGFDGRDNLTYYWIKDAQNFRDCVLYVEDDGRTVTKTGEPVDPRDMRQVMEVFRKTCLRTGATIGTNHAAKRKSLEDIESFIKARLFK
jgi:dienelactone hydrolase